MLVERVSNGGHEREWRSDWHAHSHGQHRRLGLRRALRSELVREQTSECIIEIVMACDGPREHTCTSRTMRASSGRRYSTAFTPSMWPRSAPSWSPPPLWTKLRRSSTLILHSLLSVLIFGRYSRDFGATWNECSFVGDETHRNTSVIRVFTSLIDQSATPGSYDVLSGNFRLNLRIGRKHGCRRLTGRAMAQSAIRSRGSTSQCLSHLATRAIMRYSIPTVQYLISCIF